MTSRCELVRYIRIRASIYIYAVPQRLARYRAMGACYVYKYHRYILLSCALYAVRTRKQRVHEVSLAGSRNDKRSRAAHKQYIGIRVRIIIYTDIYVYR